MKRILVYSHDTYGLGNIRRMLTIAEHMIDAHDDVSVLVVSGSPMLHAFRVTPRLDYVKLPCLTRLAGGEYGVKSLGLSYEATLRMRSQILSATVAEFDPDLILVDKKPFGVDDELADALHAVRAKTKHTALVLLLRDILDAPETTSSIWRKNGYFEAIDEFYDSVLVLGSESVFDLPVEYDFPAAATSKVDFCGYLRRPRGRLTRAELRTSLGVAPDEKLVLVTSGGGQDGAMLVRCYVESLTRGEPIEAKTVLILGPEMSETDKADLLRLSCELDDLTVIEFTDDMMSYVAASDLVVAMGGYNTVCEFLSAERRAVVVPRVRPVREQLIRAELLARMGRISLVHPDDLSPETLAEAVRAELGHAPDTLGDCDKVGQVDMGGLDRVEKLLAVLLDDE